MPQMRFLGVEPAWIAPLSRTVQPDEAVEIPDELVWDEKNPTDEDGNPVGYVWPEGLWAVVGSGRRRSQPVNKEAAEADTGSGTDASKED